MTITFLSQNHDFPHPSQAGPDGLLAIGGDLSPSRLLSAYATGIFPWYGPGSPILWWSPDPRLILYPHRIHLSRRLHRVLNSGKFEITADLDFEQVILSCARASRKGSYGTWLVPEMIEAYIRLHQLGYAHCFEAWHKGRLAGAIYGVALGGIFFGESMFYRVSDASKVALVHLCDFLEKNGFLLMDCQQTTGHMLRFGAVEISRTAFLTNLKKADGRGPGPGKWSISN